MDRPKTAEYAPFYAGYVSQVPENDILDVLSRQPHEIGELLDSVAEERGLYAYAEGKWTINELIAHINDTERVFGYRAFRIAHGDATPLPSFDQDFFVANGRANERAIADLVGEFRAIREANLLVLARLNDHEWMRMGMASDAAVSVRAVAYIMAGHFRHHLAILRHRYLA
ncbi:DinB family protein [soil metagenome]